MLDSKFRDIEAQQTPIARKVLDVVPMAEPWDAGKITAELYRQGKRVAMNVVEGCLHHLYGVGLVRKSTEGGWIRTPYKREVQPEPKATELTKPTLAIVAAPAPQSAPAVRNLLTEAGKLADDLRAIAQRADDMATAIDNLALEYEDRIKKAEEGSEKLVQLRSLLRSIDPRGE